MHCGLILPDNNVGEIARAIADGFAENGGTVEYFPWQSTWDFRRCDFALTYGPMEPLTATIARLRRIAFVAPLVVWFTEQPPPPMLPHFLLGLCAQARYSLERLRYDVRGRHSQQRWQALLNLFGRAGRLRALGEILALKRNGPLALVCTFTETTCRFLQRYGLPVRLIPMGYHPIFGEQLTLKRDIDVVFLGSTRDQRRKVLIRELEKELLTRRLSFVIKDGSPNRGYAFGRDRVILLNRSKIMLNIMRQPWDDPVCRLLLAAPNGAMLLSERLWPTSTGPFRVGEHFAMADVADIPDAIAFFLSREDERQRIAESASGWVTGNLTMGKMVGNILQALESLT